MSIEKMRGEFEATFKQADLSLHETGHYANSATYWAWAGWQASRAALVVELPTQSEGNRPYNQGIYDTKIAIEAAGVKVKS